MPLDFVGLTRAAESYLASATLCHHIPHHSYNLGVWVAPAPFPPDTLLYEVIFAPFGPANNFIFTYLQSCHAYEPPRDLFLWVMDPTLHEKGISYDYESGRFWI